MDPAELIAKLRAERVRMDQIIASLEELRRLKEEAKPHLKSRRGRKSMDEAGRREVSERMKKYWATRRQKPEQ